MFKKAMINLLMIETVILSTSLNLAFQVPASNGVAITFAMVWLVTAAFSLLPALAVSFLFAAISGD